MNCKIVKRITDGPDGACADGLPPSRFGMWECGPSFLVENAYYYYDGCTGKNFPTHDPCGKNSNGGLKNVENPHGNVFVR